MRWVAPWPAGKRITSGYGVRRHPILYVQRKHRGVDVAGRFNVPAAGDPKAPGVFHSKGYNASGGGHWAKVEHVDNGKKYYSVYYHLAKASRLHKGDVCIPGETVIGTSGSTGMSTGDHLHYEIRTSPKWGTDIDPTPIVGRGSEPVEEPSSGRFDRETVRAWQEVLKRDWRYRGRIDGVLGPLSWSAIQESLKAHGYRGRVDGVPGPLTFKALQRKLGRPETGRLTGEDIKTLKALLESGGY